MSKSSPESCVENDLMKNFTRSVSTVAGNADGQVITNLRGTLTAAGFRGKKDRVGLRRPPGLH